MLFYGILGALLMRGLFIGLGTAAARAFHWILYIFGAMLIVTGIRMAFKSDEEFDGDQNPIVQLVRRLLPLSEDSTASTSSSSRTVAAGDAVAAGARAGRVHRPGLRDRFDSGDLRRDADPFLVFTSNIFAVLGLRSLYFLLAAVVHRFHLLKYGLAVILTLRRRRRC